MEIIEKKKVIGLDLRVKDMFATFDNDGNVKKKKRLRDGREQIVNLNTLSFIIRLLLTVKTINFRMVTSFKLKMGSHNLAHLQRISFLNICINMNNINC